MRKNECGREREGRVVVMEVTWIVTSALVALSTVSVFEARLMSTKRRLLSPFSFNAGN